MISATYNPEPTIRKLGTFQVAFRDNLSEDMDDLARIIAVSLATSARPYGIGQDSKKAGEIAVVRDIYKIYVSPKMVYNAISNRDANIARTFSKLLRGGAYGQVLALIGSFAPQYSMVQCRPFDGGALHKARRNNRGGVPKSQKPLMLVTDPGELYRYVEQEKAKVGFGKAGWGNCAKAFKSGRAATRGLPGWITRHTTAPSATAKSIGDSEITILLQNNVEYAQNLLSGSAKGEAVAIAITRMEKNWKIRAAKALKESALP